MKIITVAYDITAVPSRTYSYWKKVIGLSPDISNKQSQINIPTPFICSWLKSNGAVRECLQLSHQEANLFIWLTSTTIWISSATPKKRPSGVLCYVHFFSFFPLTVKCTLNCKDTTSDAESEITLDLPSVSLINNG